MKNVLIGLLVCCVFGCSTNTKREAPKTASTSTNAVTADDKIFLDLQNFYFPLSDTVMPTTYVYEVLTRSKEMKDDRYFEFLKFKRMEDGNYVFTRFEKSMNLIDSMIFNLDASGANVVKHYIKTQDNNFVEADVSPSLLYPWKREVNARMTNEFSYASKVNGQQTKTSIRVNSGFVGFEDVPNMFSEKKVCAKIVHQTQAKFQLTSPPKEVMYTSKGENINLIGIGLYKSIEMNNHGDTTIKKLVEIRHEE